MKRYKVRILPAAYNDLKDAKAWYAHHNKELPQRFLQQVDLSIERIRTTPFAYSIRYKDVRIANTNVFPYGVHYLISSDMLIIIAIHHTAISPKKWLDRIKS